MKTEIKEKPILFNGEMVRAILDGRKTQTRRVVKPQPVCQEDSEPNDLVFIGGELNKVSESTGRNKRDLGELTPKKYTCPYGQKGDQLWVREKFQPLWDDLSLEAERDYKTGEGYHINYPATDGYVEWIDMYSDDISSNCKPSIHMPRWASRIQLEISDIRVERVQEISEDDCQAEGLKLLQGGIKAHFAILWDSINGKKSGCVWWDNPWVWIVEFKVVK